MAAAGRRKSCAPPSSPPKPTPPRSNSSPKTRISSKPAPSATATARNIPTSNATKPNPTSFPKSCGLSLPPLAPRRTGNSHPNPPRSRSRSRPRPRPRSCPALRPSPSAPEPESILPGTRLTRSQSRFCCPVGVLPLRLWQPAKQPVERLAVERFALEQLVRDQLQLVEVLDQDVFGFGIGAVENLLHLFINRLSGLLAAIALERPVHAGQIHCARPLRATRQPDTLAHPEQTNHLAGQRRCVLQVILRAGGHLLEDNLLRRAATQHAANAVQQLRARHQKVIVRRHLQRISQRVAHFVIRHAPFLLLLQSPALALGARNDLFDGVF